MAGESNSIQHQRTMLTEFATAHGFGNLQFYIDDGISGTTFHRPGFIQMYKDIESDQVGTVIVKDMSRFGRNYLQVGLYLEDFLKQDIRFIAMNDGIDTAKGEDEMLPFRNVFNEWHARDTSKKIRAYMQQKGNNGEHLCTVPPYGYYKNPENPKQWLVDTEAASVVRKIFALCLAGYGPAQIARQLTQEHVLVPSAYAKTQGRNIPATAMNDDIWNSYTVASLLEHREYTGCTVNFKTYSKSYKDHKIYDTPLDKQAVFENTQEAIVDRETWERVQELRANKRRPTRTGKSSMFSGLLFCGDCGEKMYFATGKSLSANGEYFVCAGSRKVSNKCTAHFIREAVLKELVLEHLRQVLSFAKNHEDVFVKLIHAKALSETKRELNGKRRQLDWASARTEELDRLFQRIYEDNVNGKLTDEQFQKLSANYTAEQATLKEQATILTAEITALEAAAVNVSQFLKLVRKYTDITELNATILNEFIRKILIFAPEKKNGKRIQKITIVFNFIGLLPEAADPEEHTA